MNVPLQRTLGIVALSIVMWLALLVSAGRTTCDTNCEVLTFFTTKTSSTSAGGIFVVVEADNTDATATCAKEWRTDRTNQIEDGDTVPRKYRPVVCQSGWYYVCFSDGTYDGKIGCTKQSFGNGNPEDLDGCVEECLTR